MTTLLHQQLPTSWSKREMLRDKGQFWTPEWVARAMVVYAMANSDQVFDPATGEGAFCTALTHLNQHLGRAVQFYGTDVDPQVIQRGIERGIYNQPGVQIEVRDFILDPPERLFKAIVANPPYVRHHRLTDGVKNRLKAIGVRIVGETLDGRAGLHVYFLIQALSLLDSDGRLAFIVPADTCEGVFAKKLWRWIASRFRIDGVITFRHDATPFPNVDTNAVVLLIRNQSPAKELCWVHCKRPNADALCSLLCSEFSQYDPDSLEVRIRKLSEALETGFSRFPRDVHESSYKLSNFARVMRGVATGANEFFFLTKAKAMELSIPPEFLKPAIGRTRDVEGSSITREVLGKLEMKGRPTLLFSPDGRSINDFPPAVTRYFLKGEKADINKRALIMTRRPWYKMETREPPEFLFAYLGRRNVRFIKNEAKVIPLTGFLCVYSLSKDREYVNKLWRVLQAPETIQNLAVVGKSYGAGAIKVEPRALEGLPLSADLVEKLSLKPLKTLEPTLFDGRP